MEETNHTSSSITSASSTTTTTTTIHGDPSISAPSSSLPSSSSTQVQVLENEVDEENPEQQQQQQQQQERQEAAAAAEEEENQRQEENQISISSNGVNIQEPPSGFSSDMRDDACSCLVVLVTFWFFASMTVILGFYGPENLRVGPNCSRLLQANSFFIKQIKVEELAGPDHGVMLYGFYRPPPLDVVTTWSETYNTSLPADSHEDWMFFLNKGSEINITYSVDSENSSPLFLVIAEEAIKPKEIYEQDPVNQQLLHAAFVPLSVRYRGRENLIEWTETPSYPNLTLSWNVIHGSGMIQQKIFQSSAYYVAVGNLNSRMVEVQLNIRIRAFLYNTTKACYKCSLSHGPCSFNLMFLGASAAVLTSPGPEQGSPSDDGYVKLRYCQRWISYFIGSGAMTLLLVLVFKMCAKFQSTDGAGYQAVAGSERAPLLVQKDDDLSSWGSSYDSVSHDDEDLEEALIASALEAKPLKDGENGNPRRLCVICFDAPRDCFFLPCGHCAACFTCGTRIAEEAGTCPICRRKMKKVRKIFAV